MLARRSTENCKDELDKIYDEIAKGVTIRSKCNWHEHSGKSFFKKVFSQFGEKVEQFKTL